MGNCPLLLERVAFGFGKKPRMDIYGIAAHRTLHSPLGKVLLILPVECQEEVFNHRPHEFFDGRFHSAHPSVVALLADTRKAHFLVLGDLWRGVSKLAVEWLTSDYPLQNPTRKQILFRVSRLGTEDASFHVVKSSRNSVTFFVTILASQHSTLSVTRLHYLFLDESYPPSSSTGRSVVMAAWAVEQGRLNRYKARLPELFRPPVLARIEGMLESLDARAVVGIATLDAGTFRPGEFDGTDDVPRMARTDNVWSQCAVFTIGALIRYMFGVRQEVGTVDIHFDPKSLTPGHRGAIERTLRGLLKSEARRYAAERNSSLLRKFNIRRFEAVSKSRAGETRNKFQAGTWVADKLCSNAANIEQAKRGQRIRIHDMSDVVRRTIRQFDGKPFNED
jgi:hypothetical protein